ncbi:MAG: CRTAC1 family protein [Aestuariivirgaceae bacterium]|nr:CRTAC1 family protein [Aestuariivirgaceae bacterium]
MFRLILLLVLCFPALAHAGPTTPRFIEETAKSGIDSTFAGDWEYMVGGGVAVFDCDGDGLEDVLLSGGTSPAKFYRNESGKWADLRFSEAKSGLELEQMTGAYPLDIDGDNITDLVILRVGENVVMRGQGQCRFVRANEDWSFDGGDGWSTAFAATWEKGASWPTLAIGNYVDRTQEDFPWGSCTDNWLHRGAGSGFAAPVALKPSYCALSMLFTDWNRSGTPSLRVSNDREYYKGGQEQLWHLEPGAAPRLYTVAEGWKRLRIWGMGIASTDLDADGYPEYFLTSMADNKLQSLVVRDGAPLPDYADVAWPRGVTAQRPHTGGEVKPSTAWHAQFEDVNNDGLADLFVAKGNVTAMPDFAMKDPNNLLVQGADGRFVEMAEAAGVASFETARGAALADFNQDGLLDLIVVNRGSRAQIWRNETAAAGNWIALRLKQPGPNADAIGAWVEVRRGDALARREVTSGGGHASGQLGWIHFGLGDAAEAEVRVIWPDGAAGDWKKVTADTRFVTERRPAE